MAHPFLSPGSTDERLHPYLALLARYWAIVLGAAIVGGLVGFGLSQLATPSYTAKSTLYFSINYGDSGSDLNQGATYAQSQMLSFAELARSSRVLEPVIDNLELDTTPAWLAQQIDVRTPENTVVLDISANSTDPELAASISNEIAQSLTATVREVAPRDENSRSTVTVRTVEDAAVPTVASSPNTRVNTVAGVLLGLLLAILVIVIRRAIDTRVRSSHDLEKASGMPVLARVDGDTDADEGLVLARDVANPAAEGYRRLRAVLDGIARSRKTGARSIAVTAPIAGQGASTVAANLALAYIESGRNVLLVGSDIDAGAVDTDSWPSATVVTLNDVAALFKRHSSNYDVLVFDAGDLASSSSALTIGQLVDNVVLVADASSVHTNEVRNAVRELASAGITPAGTVLTHTTSHSGVRIPRLRRGALPVLEHNNA